MSVTEEINKFISEHSSNTGDPLRDTRDALNAALARLDTVKTEFSEFLDSVEARGLHEFHGEIKRVRAIIEIAGATTGQEQRADWVEQSHRMIQQTEAETSRLLATKIISDWSGSTNAVLLEALTELHTVSATVFPPENEKVPRLWREAIEKARAAINQAEIFQHIAEEEKAAADREESRLLASAKKLARYMGWQGQETAEMRVIADFLEAIAEKEAETAATKNQPANQEMHIALIEILSEAKNLYNRPRKFMAACQKGYRALATYSATCQENGNEDFPLEEWAKESGDAPVIGGETETEIWPPLPV